MISEGHKTNFNTLLRAFDDGNVCLMECTDKATGKPTYVVCAVHAEGVEIVTTPLAKMFDGNPYDEVEPPK